MAYATTGDLTSYIAPETAPANASFLLARASETIDYLITGAVYEVDDDELPTDAATAEALKRATCAQAFYLSGQADPTGAASTYASRSYTLGAMSESVTNKTTSGGDIVIKPFSDHAIRILRNAGLMPPYLYGG